MKAMRVVSYLCIVLAALVLFVNAQPAPCSNEDFYIYNDGRAALRIDSSSDHVYVCDNKDLCNFISSMEESSSGDQGVFTEVRNSAFKTIPGSIYVAGTANTADTTYDGLASEITAPQTFLWYGSKAAFRAGEASLGQTSAWSPSNIGVQSAAFGFNTIAIGVESFAAGEGTTSSGYASTAFGRLSLASGNASTANGLDVQNAQQIAAPNQQIKDDVSPHNSGNPDTSVPSLLGPTSTGIGSSTWGLSTRANNTASTAFGFASFASGPASSAWGVQSEAFGEGATSFGFRTYANDTATTSWGVQTQASSRRATAWGYESIAAWPDSTASGYANAARAAQSFIAGIGGQVSSHAATVLGSCNTDYTDANPSATNEVGNYQSGAYPGRKALSKDYILQVGNGASGSEDPNVCYSLSSALTVLKNGDLYVAGNIYYGVGPDPYSVESSQHCKCLSADGSCEINSLSQHCLPTIGSSEEAGDSSTFYSNNKRSVEEVQDLRAQLAELKAQFEEFKMMVKA